MADTSDRKDAGVVAAGILATAIDRAVAAVENPVDANGDEVNVDDLTDEQVAALEDGLPAAASSSFLADAAVMAIAATEFAYGARSGQIDEAAGGLVRWVPTSGSPCEECVDRADDDPIDAADADPDGLHPNCSCGWEQVDDPGSVAGGAVTRSRSGEGLHSTSMAAIETDTAGTSAPASNPEADPTGQAAQWHAILAVEGVPTDDGRLFDPGSFTWRDLPFTLTRNLGGHGEGQLVVAGRVDTLERQGSAIYATGGYDTGPDGVETARMVAEHSLGGISADYAIEAQQIRCADPSMAGEDWDLYDEAGEPVDLIEATTAAKIMGACVTNVPAFSGTVIRPISEPLPPIPTAAAPAPVMASVASLDEARPDPSWFTNPNRDGRPGLDIHPDGRVEGYVCLWGTPHIGRADRRCPPRSSHPDYLSFRQGYRVCSDGSKVATGPLSIGGGHADDYAPLGDTRRHYDDVTTAWADVAAGEDEHGLWVAGAVRPGVPPQMLTAAAASALSGDWRPIGGQLELVAVLSVNTPGFPQVSLSATAGPIVLPVERFRLTLVDGLPVSLVAAGVARPDPVGDHLRSLASRVHRLECELADSRVQRARTRLRDRSITV
ncbi:MAG: hypothetical protein M3N98_16075 [Actinomycetota bacterium]|nr:hypothetical protein [Actinomycetota bacterium]